MLEALRGKRMLFVGDSFNRGQFISMVCLLHSLVPKDGKSMKSSLGSLSVFRLKVQLLIYKSLMVLLEFCGTSQTWMRILAGLQCNHRVLLGTFAAWIKLRQSRKTPGTRQNCSQKLNKYAWKALERCRHRDFQHIQLVDEWHQDEDTVMSLIPFYGSPCMKQDFPFSWYFCWQIVGCLCSGKGPSKMRCRKLRWWVQKRPTVWRWRTCWNGLRTRWTQRRPESFSPACHQLMPSMPYWWYELC